MTIIRQRRTRRSKMGKRIENEENLTVFWVPFSEVILMIMRGGCR